MSKKTIKETGATFTPRLLADFLAEKIIEVSNVKNNPLILDPACGDGELLMSISEKLIQLGHSFSIKGFDLDMDYLTLAESRLSRLNQNGRIELINSDFLDQVIFQEPGELDLFSQSRPNLNGVADIVIANPPYVRTQILGQERAQLLANQYGLKGRVDLYYPFLMAMTESLKIGGIIGVITSNRFLFTKSGESIRQFLSNNYEIIEVIDLGDTKLFDAAVLPAIFIGRKIRNNAIVEKRAIFNKIYETQEIGNESIALNNITEVLTDLRSGFFQIENKHFFKSKGILRYDVNSSELWRMFSEEENEWIEKIENAKSFLIKDFFKVRVGIKTTADKIFIRHNWDQLNGNKPEEELLHELISQENITKWKLNDKRKLFVLYTHYSEGGVKKVISLERFPKAKSYFESYKAELSGRTYVIEANREWYEIWVSQNPLYFKFPKIVFPDISDSSRFYFDNTGKIVNGNCYWFFAEKEEQIDLLLLIQGVSNTKLMAKYHDLVFNNKLYSGKRRYISQYVENYPMPNPNSAYSKEIVRIVKQINQSTNTDFSSEELEIEKLTEKAFNLT
jgi:adenine-specific DNA-methyltransferase